MIDKPGKGAFYQTDLELMLKNREIDTLFVCGVTTEVCVNTTVREANDRGFRCIVLSDCCASYFPEFHAAGLAMIKAQGGIFGWVSASPHLLAAMDCRLSNRLCAAATGAQSVIASAQRVAYFSAVMPEPIGFTRKSPSLMTAARRREPFVTSGTTLA